MTMSCFFILYLLRFWILPHLLDVEHFLCYFSDKDLRCSSTVWYLHACREWTDCWVKYVCSCSRTDLRSEQDVLRNCTLLSGQEIFIYLFPSHATPDLNGMRTEQGMAVLVLRRNLCSLCIYKVIWLRNAWANSGFAWKLREFLLVWKQRICEYHL